MSNTLILKTRLNTFRLRVPKMYAQIIATEGNNTFTVCESETVVANVTSSGCQDVCILLLLVFLLFNKI